MAQFSRVIVLLVAMLSLTIGPARGTTVAAPPDGAILPRIVNGNLTSAMPSVGILLIGSDPTSAGLRCSGTLIGCHTFLTAAHCVCDATGADAGAQCQPGGDSEPNPAFFLVFLQNVGFVAVDRIAVNPAFNFPIADVAVLDLAQPVSGVRPATINTLASPALGSRGVIAGFGRGGGVLFDYGLKRAGNITTSTCGDPVSDETLLCWKFQDPLGPPGTNSNTCNGDSGGPLFIDQGSGPLLSGTTSGGLNGDCEPTDRGYDVNIFAYQGFIADQAGSDLSSTSCGNGPQVGDPEVVVHDLGGNLSSTITSAQNSFSVPATTTLLRIAMNATADSDSDFDLYVKAGSPASSTDFDCKADGPNQFGACEFPSPTPGKWYVLVQRNTGGGSYQLTATLFGAGCGPTTDGEPCDDSNPCTENDTCVATTCVGTAVVDGTPCDDGHVCTPIDACASGVCVGSQAPRTGCKEPLVTHASMLALRDASNDRNDSLTWTWRRGAATTIADFGDPVGGGSIDLCLYDESLGTPSVVLEESLIAPALWKTTAKGFRFLDARHEHGGLSDIALRAGPSGAASITVKAKGAELALPPLPLHQSPAVTAQLVTENACFSATFSTPKSDTNQRYNARSQ